METIVVQPSTAEELRIIKEFLEKKGIKSRILSEENKEDLVLGLIMTETDYNDIVDTTDFIAKLKGE